MRAPDGPLGENLHANCFGLHVIPVDERPLIGSTWVDEFSLHMLHSYLRSDMGCVSLCCFFLYDAQLPPVLDAPVLSSPELF